MLLERPGLLLSLLVGLGLLGPSAAAAEPTAPAPSAASCAKGLGSLAYIGCSLAAALLPSATGTDVAVLELKSDRDLPAPDALRERLRESVRAALAKPVAGASPAEAEQGKLRVELNVEKVAGTLRVTANLRRATGLWQRLRRTSSRSLLHGFVEAPIDAELRALIPPPPLVVSSILKVKAPERGIVALACGELGPEGGQELALVSRSSVRVGRIIASRFAERGMLAWSALSPVAPAPLREPIATAEITAAGVLRVGITDRRDGIELNGALQVTARYQALLPAPGGGCVAPSGVGLSGQISQCAADQPGAAASLGVLDALSGARTWQLGRDLASGKVRQNQRELAELGRVGAQLAVGDADGDGTPELAYSADVLEPARDRLMLVSLTSGKPSRRFELPAAGISAIAICNRPEGSGMAPLALVSGDELWLVR
ncbi:MAG TPA: hypothetical protein VJN18_31395 [Polyangiaceae bacterium]|nr:hypothetical protein [Polyangiaceae bacterium]